MKKTLMLIAMMSLALQMWAYDAKVGDFYYNLNAQTQEAEVTYQQGSIQYFGDIMVVSTTNSYAGSLVIPSTITYDGTTYNVTSIGVGAFKNSEELAYVQIPSSVKSIGKYAFSECPELLSAYIPQGITQLETGAFSDCPKLESINLPNSLTSIGDDAFSGCESLVTINMHEGLQSIGGNAFNGCTSITELSIPSTLRSLGSSTFGGCRNLSNITLPEGITEIPLFCFSDCISISSISIPSTVTAIEQQAFSGCTFLSSISLPQGLEKIGKGAFQSSGLRSIIIPQGVTELAGATFFGCINLSTVEFQGQRTNVNERDFYGCTSLQEITLPGGVINNNAFFNCTNLTKITLGKNVTAVHAEAFNGCTNIERIIVDAENKILDSRDNCNAIITTANNELIVGCANSKIPNTVEIIGEGSLKSLTGLTELDIPRSIKEIKSKAFAGLTNLQEIHVRRMTPPTLADDAFPNYNAWLHVYPEAEEDYLTADGWKKFNNQFPGLPFAIESFTLEQTEFNISYGQACQIKVKSWYPDIDDFNPSILQMTVSDPEVTRVLDDDKRMILGITSGTSTVTIAMPDERGIPFSVQASIAVSEDGSVLPPPAEVKRCEEPVITFNDGKIEATCATPGAVCEFSYQLGGVVGSASGSAEPQITLIVKAQAKAPGYEYSPIAIKKLYLNGGKECDGDVNGDTKVSISDVNALINKLLGK